jgi:hypothetical protein
MSTSLFNFRIVDDNKNGLEYLANEEPTDVSKLLNRIIKKHLDKEKKRINSEREPEEAISDWPVIVREGKAGRKPKKKAIKKLQNK